MQLLNSVPSLQLHARHLLPKSSYRSLFSAKTSMRRTYTLLLISLTLLNTSLRLR
ncbi:MAG: hypothetical protein GY772_29645 [bacterium]|nr:hypothetical protein [bacterium]